MDDSPVVGQVAGRNPDDIKSDGSDLLDLSRTDSPCSSAQTRLGAENSPEGGSRLCGRPPDQDGNAWRVKLRLTRFQNEVRLIASADPVDTFFAFGCRHREAPRCYLDKVYRNLEVAFCKTSDTGRDRRWNQ
jgi:hypothetical protein